MTEEHGEIDVGQEDQHGRLWVSWDRHHAKIGWVTLGLLIGGMIGWWVGGLTSCASSDTGCEVSVGAVEAAGTWFGGIGAMLAVGAGIATLRASEKQRLDEQRRLLMTHAEREAAALAAAEQVKIRCQIGAWNGENVSEVRLHVTNLMSEGKVHKISGEWDGFGPLKALHMLAPGRTHVTTYGLESPRSRPGGQWELAVPMDERDDWVIAQRARVRVQYEIDGQWWQRTGDEPPEPMQPKV